MHDLIDIYNNVPKNQGSPQTYDEYAKFVEMRYYAMTYVKQQRRDTWQGVQNLYYCNDWEWIVNGEGFEKPVRFPTLRDFTKALTDKFMQDPPEALLLPMSDDEEDLVIGKKKYIDSLKESLHEKKVRRQVIEDMFFFGEGFREVGFYHYERMDDDNTPVTLFRDVATRRVDPRDVFVDETAITLHDKTRMNGARDMIVRTLLPYSTFLKKFSNQPGFYNIDSVRPEPYVQAQGLDYRSMNYREYWEKSPVQVVKLYEYQNIEEDKYCVVANGFTIYEDKLSECKGTDSFNVVNYKFEPRNDSFWGNCLGELLAAHIYAKDTIFNLELLNLKLTLQPVMAVSGEFGYNPRVHVLQPGGVWTAGGKLNGKVADNISPVIAGNPNTKAFDMLQNINSELSITSRADLRTLEFYQGKTATEVMSQQQSMNAHNEFIEDLNEIEAEGILTELMMQVCKEFMSEKDHNTGETRRVQVKDYVVNQMEGKSAKFMEKKGYEDFYTLTDEMINVDAKVKIIDKRGEKITKMEKMGRLMQFIPMVGNLLQLDPTLKAQISVHGLLEEAVDAIGLDKEKVFTQDELYEDQYEMVKEEILLGHNVDVQEETRKESMNRLRYLKELYKQYGKGFNPVQKQAYLYHLDQTMKSIDENKIEKLQQQLTGSSQQTPPNIQQMLQQQGPGGQPNPQQVPQGPLPGMSPQTPQSPQAMGAQAAQQVQQQLTPQQQGGIQQIPQPLPGLLSATGTKAGIPGMGQ